MIHYNFFSVDVGQRSAGGVPNLRITLIIISFKYTYLFFAIFAPLR